MNEESVEERDERMVRVVSASLRQVFGEHEDSRRFIDVTRIPLICQNIKGIHDNITELKDFIKDNIQGIEESYVTKDAFLPVKSLVFGAVGLILIAIVGAGLALIIR